MKCTHCNYESEKNFDRCPVCGTPATSTQNVGANYQNPPTAYQANNYYNTNYPYNYVYASKRTTGEKVAIGIAIVVSVISVIAAFFILMGYMTYTYITYTEIPDDYASVSSDFEDDFYDDFHNDGYSDIHNKEYSLTSPAKKNTPIEFKENLYSSSNDYVNTTYEVEMEETYCGAAAIKMLDGATLPEIKDSQEFFLVKFNVTITDQEKKSYVMVSPPYAYAFSSTGTMYLPLYSINYADDTQLLTKGKSGTRWIAFIIDENEKPYITWNINEMQFFRNMDNSISNAAKVTKGEAVDQNA